MYYMDLNLILTFPVHRHKPCIILTNSNKGGIGQDLTAQTSELKKSTGTAGNITWIKMC